MWRAFLGPRFTGRAEEEEAWVWLGTQETYPCTQASGQRCQFCLVAQGSRPVNTNSSNVHMPTVCQ